MSGTWTTPIDIYCERLDAGFWAEPINAITNAAFLIAAAAAYLGWRKSGADDRPALFLIGVLTAIGIGSFLFHTFANRWSVLADVIPITIFIYVYFFFAMRRFFGASLIWSLGITIAFLAASFAFDAVLPQGFMNGSGSYLPAIAAILIVGLLLVRRWPALAWTVLLGGAVIVVSVTARSVDMAVCPGFPLGTHFLWHVLNAVALYILLGAMVNSRAGREPQH